MTTYINPAIRQPLSAGFDWNGKTIGIALLHKAAVPGTTPPISVDSLVAGPGFQEVAATGYGYTRVTQPCNSSITGGVTSVTTTSDFTMTLTAPVYVQAVAYYLVGGPYFGASNPWIFISDDMVGNVMTPGTQINVPGTPNTLFTYSPRGPIDIDMSMGRIVQSPGPMTWDPARCQHIYLRPQRINWLPNPSFEDTGIYGWRSSGTMARTVGGVDNPSNYFMRVTGTSLMHLESLPVPLRGRARLSAYLRSSTLQSAQLALGCWSETYESEAIVYSRPMVLTPTWTRYDALLTPADDAVAISALVVASSTFDVDLMLLEDGEALHDYWDGDSHTSMVGDFSWQGVSHQSYSFWYNNRYEVGARLFGKYINSQVTQDGLVWDFVPSDTAIATHWDVLDETDTKHPLDDWVSRVKILPVTGSVDKTLANTTAATSAAAVGPFVGSLARTLGTTTMAASGFSGFLSNVTAPDVSLGAAATGFPSITSSPGTWSVTPGSIVYQWQERTRSGGGAWTNSAGTGNATATYSGVQDLKEYCCRVNADGLIVYTPTVMVFGYTGVAVDFTTASDYTIEHDLYGACGGRDSSGATPGTAPGTPGNGQRLVGRLAVPSGAAIRMSVGGKGGNGVGANGGTGGPGGFNGGGNGGGQGGPQTFNRQSGGGGGATDMRIGGTAESNRKMVAGGGGGCGSNYTATGNNGGSGGNAPTAGAVALRGGGAGTPTAGGAAGTNQYGAQGAASAGTITNGGNGSTGSDSEQTGGGGGAGRWGGGGGGQGATGGTGGGGGGGGQGFADPAATGIASTDGLRNDNGCALLVLRPPQPLDVVLSTAATGFPTLTASTLLATSYQWQERTRASGGAWTNSAGTGNATATYSGVQNNKEYRCATVVASVTYYTPIVMVFDFTGAGGDVFVTTANYTIDYDLYGAHGGDGDSGSAGQKGGNGGRVQCRQAVPNGSMVTVTVGGMGGTPRTAGFNGGGTGGDTGGRDGGGGAGATDVRIGSTALTDRKVVAGGGGGSGNQTTGSPAPGGVGGGLVGGTGTGVGTGGTGGTQSAGGTGASDGAQNGALGVGGNAVNNTGLYTRGGGGGGGGYWGGGGGFGSNGVGYAGGGGGSSYTDPAATNVVHTQDVRQVSGLALLILR